MIGKKIPSRGVSNKASRVTGLANYLAAGQTPALRAAGLAEYITAWQGDAGKSKCVVFGSLGFQSEDFEGQKTEMLWGAEMAPRSADPIAHYVFSWPEQERPAPAQFQQAVGIAMSHLGLVGHQAFCAVHDDTDNLHLHLVVNRVNMDTCRVQRVNGGWDHEAVLQTVALVEQAQGWMPEARARWKVQGGELVRVAGRREDKVPGRIQDQERRTGEESSVRMAQQVVGKALATVTTWPAFHTALAKGGLGIERKGSGAVFVVGEVVCKASMVGRTASLAALEKRFGAFEERPAGLAIARAQPKAQRSAKAWREYLADRQEIREKVAKAKGGLRAEQRQALEALRARQRQRRREALVGDWRGRGRERNTLASLIAARQAAEQAHLRDQHRKARVDLLAGLPREVDYASWLKQRGNQAGAVAYRLGGDLRLVPENMRETEDQAIPAPRDIRSFVGQVKGNAVYYAREGEKTVFADRGREIRIHAQERPDAVLDKEAIRAALQLALTKWGKVKVDGNEEYMRICEELMREEGITLEGVARDQEEEGRDGDRGRA